MCVRCVFVFLVTALYCFSMDILSEINFMMKLHDVQGEDFHFIVCSIYAVVMSPSVCMFVCLSPLNCHRWWHRFRIRDDKAPIGLLL